MAPSINSTQENPRDDESTRYKRRQSSDTFFKGRATNALQNRGALSANGFHVAFLYNNPVASSSRDVWEMPFYPDIPTDQIQNVANDLFSKVGRSIANGYFPQDLGMDNLKWDPVAEKAVIIDFYEFEKETEPQFQIGHIYDILQKRWPALTREQKQQCFDLAIADNYPDHAAVVAEYRSRIL